MQARMYDGLMGRFLTPRYEIFRAVEPHPSLAVHLSEPYN